MKIAIVAPIDERIPPIHYGGIGRIVSELTNGLVDAGHDVVLLASKNSRSKARILPVFSESLEKKISYTEDRKARAAYFQIGISKIIHHLRAERFDLVNNHFGWMLVPYLEFVPAPIVTSLHAPLDQINKQITFKEYKKSFFISTSMAQRKPLPRLHYLANIYNGIDVDQYNFSSTAGDYFVFLGRMSPEKGAFEAIQVARKLKIKLIMAGAVLAWDKEYFFSKIQPYIDGQTIRFVGEINDVQKNKLLGSARALLAPTNWEEPFGLVFVEAMACGTPVISMNRGSAPEIILHGKTGFIARSFEQLLSYSKLSNSIDRFLCRKQAERFTAKIMVGRYIKTFSTFLKRVK